VQGLLKVVYERLQTMLFLWRYDRTIGDARSAASESMLQNGRIARPGWGRVRWWYNAIPAFV